MHAYVIRDGAFTLRNGRPSSNLINYEGFAKRYLVTFEHVTMVGRLFDHEDATALPVEGPGVDFIAIPGYHGLWGFLQYLPIITRLLWRTTQHGHAYILRTPATVPTLYSILLWSKGIPFAMEVAGDPYDAYSPQSLNNHLLAGFFRFLFVRLVRWQCRTAVATAYVTRNALQQRYPAKNSDCSFHFTSVDLPDDVFAVKHRPTEAFDIHKPRLVLTGNMQKLIKGHDVLIKAMRILADKGLHPSLTLIGYGENLVMLKQMVIDYGLNEQITFAGKLMYGKPIYDILDRSDVFVLPSRQEGLPRALLEAMARGLPAIATDVGGTSELLPADCLVPPNDPNALAKKMQEIIFDAAHLANLSSRNLETSKVYNLANVQKQRLDFYTKVMSMSSA